MPLGPAENVPSVIEKLEPAEPLPASAAAGDVPPT